MSWERPSVEARLQVVRPANGGPFVLTFTDEHGNTGSGSFDPDWDKPRADFLKLYVDGVGNPETDLVRFGRELFEATLGQPSLRGPWGAMRAASSGRPVHLTVEFGSDTHPLARLPLELLREPGPRDAYLFAEPDYSLVRTLLETAQEEWVRPDRPRVLFAWACPPGAGDPFTGDAHLEQFNRFGVEVETLPRATRAALKTRLDRKDVDYLILMVHGGRGAHHSTVALGDTQPEYCPPTSWPAS